MSKVAIQGNASGTGTFTIAAPNSNTDRTLTLPDEAGTVLTSGGAIDVDASAPADSVVIDANGNLGVGTTSDGSIGHFKNATGNATLKVEGGTTAGNDAYANIEIGNTTGTSGIFFSDTTNGVGRITYEHNGDYMRMYTGSTERMRIDSTYIYFSTTESNPTTITNGGGMAYHVPSGLKIAAAQDTCLRLNRTENSSGNIASFFFDATEVGRITVNGSSTSYVTSSDYRLKENVVDMTDAITRVKQLSPKRFNFIADADDTTVDGFLAHEAQTVVPEAVEGTHNEVDVDGNPVMQGIDQAKLVPLLTGALQEAIAKIETLETTVADLQTRVTALEATP
jgi:hypothetical protein